MKFTRNKWHFFCSPKESNTEAGYTHSDVIHFSEGWGNLTGMVGISQVDEDSPVQIISQIQIGSIPIINLLDSNFICWEKLSLLQQMLTDLPQHLKGKGAKEFTLFWHQLRASAPLNVQQMKKVLKMCISI